LRQGEFDDYIATLEQTLFSQSFPEATNVCWWRRPDAQEADAAGVGLLRGRRAA
jgi:hypothetical protein